MAVRLAQRRLPSGKIGLYLVTSINGRRNFESLRMTLPPDRTGKREMLELAHEIKARREIEIQSAQYGIIPKFKQEQDFLSYFEELSKTRHKTWNTVLLHLKDFAPRELPFKQITQHWLNDFQEFILKRVGANSANVYLHKINAALNRAVKDGIILANPCERIDIVKTKPTERTFLTLEEVQRLANTPTKHTEIKRAFLFSCFTGLRLSDVKRLTRREIVGDQLQFRQKKTGGFEYLPLTTSALQLIEPLPASDEETLFKLPKSEGGLWTHLQVWVTRAGITKHVSFHVARHTFATLALTHMKDLYMVSKLLGHKDIKHTQIYAKIVDDRKREAVSLLPQITL